MLALDEDGLENLRGGIVSMIFQEPMLALDPVYTIGDQIAETVTRHLGFSWADGRKRALEMLEAVRIPSAKRRLDAYPHEMSGGMRQRAMIALALACKPKVLLADEPTTALDATVQIQILLLLRELQRDMGMAVIFVTHDIGVAVEISDRIAVMYGGRIVETGELRAGRAYPAPPLYARAPLLDGSRRSPRQAARSDPRRAAAARSASRGLHLCATLRICRHGLQPRRDPARCARSRPQRALREGGGDRVIDWALQQELRVTFPLQPTIRKDKGFG